MKILARVYSIGLPLVSSLIALYFLYLILYPFQTMVVTKATTLVNTVPRGQMLYYTTNYCKFTTAPSTVYRSLHSVDGQYSDSYGATDGVSDVGCGTASKHVYIDPSEVPGDYYVLIDIQFHVNAIRNIDVIFKTNTFTIK